MSDLYERRENDDVTSEAWEDNPEWIFVEAKPPYFLVKVDEPLYRIDGTETFHPYSSGRFYQPKLVRVNGADNE